MHEDGVAAVELEDGVEHAEVVQSGRVRGWVVRHEEPEEGADEVLQGERDPVDVAPGGVVRDDAGEDAGDDDAEKVAGDDDGEGDGAFGGWGEFADQGEHDLWGDCCDGSDEGDGEEDVEVVGYAETDPGMLVIVIGCAVKCLTTWRQ